MNSPGGMIVPQLYGQMESEYRGENSETRVPDPNFNLKALRSNCSTYSAVSSVLSFPRSPTRSPKLLSRYSANYNYKNNARLPFHLLSVDNSKITHLVSNQTSTFYRQSSIRCRKEEEIKDKTSSYSYYF